MSETATSSDGLVHYVPTPQTACGQDAVTRVGNRAVTCPACLERIAAVKRALDEGRIKAPAVPPEGKPRT